MHVNMVCPPAPPHPWNTEFHRAKRMGPCVSGRKRVTKGQPFSSLLPPWSAVENTCSSSSKVSNGPYIACCPPDICITYRLGSNWHAQGQRPNRNRLGWLRFSTITNLPSIHFYIYIYKYTSIYIYIYIDTLLLVNRRGTRPLVRQTPSNQKPLVAGRQCPASHEKAKAHDRPPVEVLQSQGDAAPEEPQALNEGHLRPKTGSSSL